MAHKMETTTSNYVNDSIIDEDLVNARSADSGYSSHGSLSHVSSINASSLRSSMSQHYLQPIYENIPVNSFLSTTELTPTSQSIQRINEFHITSPNSSLKRSASSLPCTPYKIETPKKRRIDGKARSKTFRNMIDNIHVDENSENLDIGKFEISPIKAANVLQERNGKFERKGSFSSTPIYEDSLLKSMSVSKTDFFNTSNRGGQASLVIRKTKSFSPSKKRCLVTRNRQVAVDSSPLPADIESLFNPARKSIKRMLSRQNAIETLPEPSTSNLIDITATDIWDADINLESPVIEKSTSIETPVKRIRRNLSFNVPQQSPKKELDKIIFSKIPCSPIKQRIPATKRSSTAKDDVVAKRPLFDLSPLLTKRKSFAHLKHLDILSHLAETTTAIKMIFGYLGPKDIYNMYNVCQKWRTIVKNDAFAISQRNKCMSTMVKNKENLQRKPIVKSRLLVAIPKSPLKRANSVNLRKNSLRKASTISIMDDPLVVSNSTNFSVSKFVFFRVSRHKNCFQRKKKLFHRQHIHNT